MSDFTVQLDIPISCQRIADLFCTGLEGGYSPWLGRFEYLRTPEDSVRYTDAAFWEGDFCIRFHFDGGDDDEGSFASSKDVDAKELAQGLYRFATQARSHFNDFLNENDDAETGDVFLQCLLLGEIVFG